MTPDDVVYLTHLQDRLDNQCETIQDLQHEARHAADALSNVEDERDRALLYLTDLAQAIRDRSQEVYTPRHGWVGAHFAEHELVAYETLGEAVL